jgi:hypothetical protein
MIVAKPSLFAALALSGKLIPESMIAPAVTCKKERRLISVLFF